MFINKPETKVKRNAGLLLLCIIGIDGTIGGSIFVLLSGGVELAGAYTPLAFLLGGMLALFGGLLYAEVGTTIPRPGADLAYVFTAFKKRYYPFIFSWAVLLGDLGYLAINALGFGFYLGMVTGWQPVPVAFGAILFAAIFNIRGIKKAGKAEAITVSLLLLLIGLFAVLSLQNAEPATSIVYDDFRITGVLAATALIFTSFVGYEYIATLSGEAKDAAKTIPKAMIITILVSTVVFSSIAYFALLSTPQNALVTSDTPLLTAAEHIGSFGPTVIIPAALLATGGSLIAATMITSRRLYAIAHEGFFGSILTKLNHNHAPARAIMACSLFASLLVASQAVNFVAYMSNTVYLMGLITIAASIMLQRKKRPYLARPFRVPFYPAVPLLVIMIAGTLLLFVGLQSLLLVMLWIIIGWFAYLFGTIDTDRWRLLARGGVVFAFALLFTILIASLYAVSYTIR